MYLMAASATKLINLVLMDPYFPGLNDFCLTDIRDISSRPALIMPA